ncbi:MAG TPA: hypothetical protein VGB53_09460 [Rubricoccaceae bacterium]|jgi:hypothetical protein
MTIRRSHASTFTAALRVAVSLVGRSVLVFMLASAPTVTALTSVATDQPPRVQMGVPGQAEVLEEEIHVATLPAAPIVYVTAGVRLPDATVVAPDGRSDAPPTPTPPER